MSAGKARVQPKRTSKQPARKQPQTLNDEIRRLQQTYALLIAIQHAANYDVDFSVSDALIVILALVNESLAGLDRLEAAP